MRYCVILAVCMLFVCCSNKQDKHKVPTDKETIVYVCTGPYARKFHFTQDCDGLQNCSGFIMEMTLEKAESKGYRYCHWCMEK